MEADEDEEEELEEEDKVVGQVGEMALQLRSLRTKTKICHLSTVRNRRKFRKYLLDKRDQGSSEFGEHYCGKRL